MLKLTPTLQSYLEATSRFYHTEGIHFEFIKSHIWVLLNHGMSWIPTQQFESLAKAMTWADNIIEQRKKDASEFELSGG